VRGKHRGEHRYRKQVSVERCNVEGKRKDVSRVGRSYIRIPTVPSRRDLHSMILGAKGLSWRPNNSESHPVETFSLSIILTNSIDSTNILASSRQIFDGISSHAKRTIRCEKSGHFKKAPRGIVRALEISLDWI